MRLSVALLFCLCVSFTCSETDDGRCGELFLTVSSIKSTGIEVNWNFTCQNPPRRIRLFSDNPQKESAKLLLSLRLLTNHGYFVTNISFNYLSNSWRSDNHRFDTGQHCLNYWAASYRDSTLVQTTCLKIQPTWMETFGERIQDIPLGKLVLPGTHNSGCYKNDKIHDGINKYVVTQDKDIFTQLAFGIRYLDIRIGYYNNTRSKDEFWINHDIVKQNPLLPVLQDIKTYLNKAQKEIIILDIHRFPVGFKTHTNERHKKLVDLLFKELGDVAIPRLFQKSHGPTLREIWRQRRRLIICYGEHKMAAGSNWLWDPLIQYWGDKQSVIGLKRYITSIKHDERRSQNPLWATMAELTLSLTQVFLSFLSADTSLAHLADQVNRNVTQWYRYDFANQTNIIATDYFLGNDIIDIAIKTNLRKSTHF